MLRKPVPVCLHEPDPTHRPSYAMCFRPCSPDKWRDAVRYLLHLRIYMRAGAPFGREEEAADLWMAYGTWTTSN